MFLSGSIEFTESINVIDDCIRNNLQNQRTDIMILNFEETDSSLSKRFPQMVFNATILLPPASAIYEEINGNREAFINEYISFLSSDSAASEYISLILYSLHTGCHIVLYIPNMKENMVWLNILSSYFLNQHGVFISNSVGVPSLYDNNFDIKNVTVLYNCAFIPIQEFMIFTPNGYRPDMNDLMTWSKIRTDIAPYVYNPNEIVDTFVRMKQSLHINPNVQQSISFDVK